MGQKEQIKLFEQKRVRSVWDEEKEEWFFSVIDVVEVLTDSTNPTDYLKKMRKRDPELGIYIGTNCPQVAAHRLNQMQNPEQNIDYCYHQRAMRRNRL